MPAKVKESDTAVLLRFARLVIDMRKSQRSYFASRRKGAAAEDALQDSKRREAEVDKLANEILGYTTPSLFDQPPEVTG